MCVNDDHPFPVKDVMLANVLYNILNFFLDFMTSSVPNICYLMIDLV